MMKNTFSAVSKVNKKYFGFVQKFSISLLISLVCSSDEILVGDACVYVSKSPGNVNAKPECEPFKNSFDEHPFMLSDASAIYSKSAYLLQAQVIMFLKSVLLFYFLKNWLW